MRTKSFIIVASGFQVCFDVCCRHERLRFSADFDVSVQHAARAWSVVVPACVCACVRARATGLKNCNCRASCSLIRYRTNSTDRIYQPYASTDTVDSWLELAPHFRLHVYIYVYISQNNAAWFVYKNCARFSFQWIRRTPSQDRCAVLHPAVGLSCHMTKTSCSSATYHATFLVPCVVRMSRLYTSTIGQ
jgi:hypothetical protein